MPPSSSESILGPSTHPGCGIPLLFTGADEEYLSELQRGRRVSWALLSSGTCALLQHPINQSLDKVRLLSSEL